MGDEKGKGNENEGKDMVAKEEFDKIVAERDKLTKDIDDVRGEIFTPSYMKFLDDDGKPKEEGKPKDEGEPVVGDAVFEKMTKKELYELAKKDAITHVETSREERGKKAQKEKDERVNTEIAAFAKEHTDYQKFRPVMYGLSLDTSNKGLTLQQLYDKAKEYGTKLYDVPSEEEKKKGNAMDGMKPGNSSGTYESGALINADQAAKEAAEEVSTKLGPIPSA